jgi:hypothetical protein
MPPSVLTVAVEVPLVALLKVAAPGPDFNVQTPVPTSENFQEELLFNVQLN